MTNGDGKYKLGQIKFSLKVMQLGWLNVRCGVAKLVVHFLSMLLYSLRPQSYLSLCVSVSNKYDTRVLK